MITIGWAAEKRRLYEALLETMEENDMDSGTTHAEELGEAVDNAFAAIVGFPQTSILCGKEFGLEYRGKQLNYPHHSSSKYFLWYTLDLARNAALAISVNQVKPVTFP